MRVLTEENDANYDMTMDSIVNRPVVSLNAATGCRKGVGARGGYAHEQLRLVPRTVIGSSFL